MNPITLARLPGVVFLMCILFSFARNQPLNVSPQVFHESLGDMIDASENVRYNIFGQIQGLTAVKLYREASGAFQLHLLRNTEEKAQILILKIPSVKVALLRNKIANRLQEMGKEHLPLIPPIYPIDESQWVEKSPMKKVILRDGSVLRAILQKAKKDTLVVQTAGQLQIPIPDILIAQVQEIRARISEKGFYNPDPNVSRLFFAPTGRRLESGSGYFADYYIFFPTLAYGVTDFLSLSGGVSLIPGAESQLLYFAPKVTLEASANVGLATGFLYLSIPEEDNMTLGYAVSTFGNDIKGVTLGAAIPLTSDSDKNPILLIGGEIQLSNSAKLISENWIFTGEEATLVVSGGVRFFGTRLAADIALITFSEAFQEGGFPFIPWVDFSVFFGK